nr:MAG TPA: hypothetical protein [Caudoviricetes sp.]
MLVMLNKSNKQKVRLMAAPFSLAFFNSRK